MPSNPFDTRADPIAEKVVVGLAKIGLVSRHHTWRQAGSQSLTPTQGEILSLLRAQQAESLRLSDVAASLGLTLATVSDSVRALTDKALVIKRKSKADARVFELRLTAAGHRAADRFSGWSGDLLAGVDSLSSSEQEETLRSLMKIIRALQVRGEIPIARMCVSCEYFRPNVHADATRPHHCNLVDAAFGDRHLRLDCPEQVPAESDELEKVWTLSVGGECEREAAP